jgi:hypothetical protein
MAVDITIAAVAYVHLASARSIACAAPHRRRGYVDKRGDDVERRPAGYGSAQAVAGVAHGLDQDGFRGVAFELLRQADVHIHRARLAGEVVAPDAFKDLVTPSAELLAAAPGTVIRPVLPTRRPDAASALVTTLSRRS